jgi:hypothetical protein
MSSSDVTAGYPVHRVTKWHRWTNPHGAPFVDYVTACGKADTTNWPLGRAGTALAAELCKTCFPLGVHAYYPPAEEVGTRLVPGKEGDQSGGGQAFSVPRPVSATPQQGDTPLYTADFDGIPGMVWYSRARKVRGADLRLGDWLDSLDHRGARMIYGISWTDPESPVRTVTFSFDDTELVHANVEYDVVDPDSRVAPDGTPLVVGWGPDDDRGPDDEWGPDDD